ncbi:MAG: SDR family oxidoreductase [Balneolales bacterium]
MDLQIANQLFIVCGATSGFGLAITRALCQEHSNVIGVSRSEGPLRKLEKEYENQFTGVTGDLRDVETVDKINNALKDKTLNGILLNAAGPPPTSVAETTMKDWDEAYRLIFRWKVNLIKKLLPIFQHQKYGRILFIESQSVKQPMGNLVLSTAMRAAVVGYAKTLSQEIAGDGITVNVLAPGSHNTPAINRIINHKSEQLKISQEKTKEYMESNIPVGRMGEDHELASLALLLLSPCTGYLTGQTISHDGGSVKGLFG